jgi:hypothetical protein
VTRRPSLFGLPHIPEKPSRNYRRLSRYDETGLIWLLRGRPVTALSDATAAIEQSAGAVTMYRKHVKPPLGPLAIAWTTSPEWAAAMQKR